MDEPKTSGNEPDPQPENLGASRGTGDPQRDAEHAGSGKRAEPSTEYAANAKGEEPESGAAD